VTHACFGNLVNATLATALASLLSSRYGINVATQTDPYRIGLIVPFKINALLIANELKKLTPDDLERIILSSMEGSELFAWRHWHVARRFGAVERKADYKTNRAKFLVSAFKSSPINKETRREILQEKFDLGQAKLVLQRILNGEISVEVIEQKGPNCSPLAMPIIDKVIPHDLLRPAVPAKALAEIVKERLLSELMRLVCFHKADWEGLRTVRTIPDTIRCPMCKSTLIAATYPRDENLIKIVKKKLQRRALSSDEEKEWQRGWMSASLVQSSGRRAIVAMSGRGVGPTTASRILRRFCRNEEEFYTEILKAEREYARTRMFWD
jgi:ATP-dependent Lhr-like helicase